MKKGRKRAQITIFIIIVVVLVIVMGGLFLLNKSSSKDSLNVRVGDILNQCIEENVESGIKFISFQGGYYNAPKKYFNFSFSQVPVYFDLGVNNMPSKSNIEKEFGLYIEEVVVRCIKNDSYLNQEYSIETEKPKITVKLDKTISIKGEYPIALTKDEKTIYFKNLEYSKDINFLRIYEVISSFAEYHQKSFNFVPVSYLLSSARKNNFNYVLNYISDNEVVYGFVFNDFFEKNSSLIYNFGARYNWPQKPVEEKSVDIFPIPYMIVYSGENFSYKVQATGNNLVFEDYGDLFDINKKTGEVRFVSNEDMAGEHDILIKASDNLGNSDTEIMKIKIERIIENV